MKTYLIEFTYIDGSTEEVTFKTDNPEWTIEQWCRNRSVSSHKIIKEGKSNNKQMLFG